MERCLPLEAEPYPQVSAKQGEETVPVSGRTGAQGG